MAEKKISELAQLRIIAVSLLFACGEIDQKIEMPHVALAKQLVLQHRAERRRDRHGKLNRHMIVYQALHHAQQRDITLRYCFEQPIFLQKMLMFGMANERQMRMKNKREVSRHRATLEG